MINPLNKQRICILYDLLNKIPLAMRMTLLLLCVCAFQLHSELTYSQQTKISLNMKNSSIEKILQTIEEKSEFYFLYNSKLIDVDRKTDIRVKEEAITSVLTRLFDPSNVEYEVKGAQIILYPKEMKRIAPELVENVDQQQKRRVSGIVQDEQGEPIIGVNVMEKETSNGTITDINGSFTLQIEDNAVLQVSYIGYESAEIHVDNRSTVNIQLKEDLQELDQLVVVGYGVQKKANVVGSISQISSELLENRPVTALSNVLAGQMPGVTLIQRSGKPGASPGELRVRGVGSFGASPDALILIDGIPGNINDVSPEEVASISVLKDAASAAIYGARAANGVILVVTKSGSEGRIKVGYNGYGGFVRAATLPEYLPSWEYALAYNEAAGTEIYTPEVIQKYKDGSDPDNYPNSNWVKDLLGGRGFQTGHDLTLTGGTNMNNYYLALGYLSQDGIIEKNNYSRYNVRANMTSTLTNKLKLTTRIAGVVSEIKEPAVPGGKATTGMDAIFSNAFRFPSIYAGKLSNGDYGIGPEGNGTSAAWLESTSFYEEPMWRANFNANLDYNPIKDLTLSAIAGYNFSQKETKLFRSTFRLDDNMTMAPSSLEQEGVRLVYKTFQATANYSKEFVGHTIGALAGYSFEQQEQRTMKGMRDKFPGNDLPYLDAGSPDNQQTSGGGYNWTILSVFGRFKYDYLNRYLLEATVRRDGSSRFPPTKKYGTFPSFAAGWRISEEQFMQSTSSWLSNLKVKGSWGILGNQNIGNYPWQSMYNLGQNYTIGGIFNQGSAMATYSDPTIHWESTRTTDAGVEILLWKGLLSLDASYFYRHTTNILYKPTSSVSSVLGMNLSEMNTGSLKNTGWEFDISHRKSLGDFEYNVSGNFTIIRNKVMDLGVGNVQQPNGLIGNGSDLFIGYPMQSYYGYKTDGVFLDQNDIDAWYEKNDQSSLMPKNSARPGDVRYVDIDGDGKVTAAMDRVILGSQIPTYTFAFNIGAKYKRFDTSLFFQGVAGVKGRLTNYAGFAFYNLGSIQRWMWEGRFDSENPKRYPAYPRLQILGNSEGNNGYLSDLWTRNASYLRLKNIQVGYTLPTKLLNMWHINNLRIYISVEDPATWTKYPKGWDPEANTGGDHYPRLATYTIGVNLKF